MTEFSLIRRFFTRPARNAVLGVGDDAALLACTPGMELAVSADMLVAGRHFFADTDPWQLGWKTLAVNLSDMAAMGAAPRWALLSLALPAIDEGWLERFADGFFTLADQYQVSLVGGDTTRGPLCLSVQILGEVPKGGALRRSGAAAGDDLWVSGTPGEAALGLALLNGEISAAQLDAGHCLSRLHTPTPRVAAGVALRGIASAAIDISDGLLADLGHVLEASGAGAEIQAEKLPPVAASVSPEILQRCQLAGGDDYELLFTAPTGMRAAIAQLASQHSVTLTRIGHITADRQLRVSHNGIPLTLKEHGFDHFKIQT